MASTTIKFKVANDDMFTILKLETLPSDFDVLASAIHCFE
jgi:hypothetical protein